MSNQTVASQAQQAAPVDAFKKAFDEQMARMTQLWDESSKAQAKWQQTATTSIDEMATLLKSSLKYQAELSAEVGKVTLDVVKKTAEMFAR